jgi:hypothetical protein
MIVRSRNPIRTVNVNVKPNNSFSFADGDKPTDGTVPPTTGGTTPPADTKAKKAKTGFFSKTRRTERKDDRIKTREERRARRAKYGARPLNPFSKGGKQFWKDKLPKLKKKANGDFEKTMPDGSIVIVKGKDVTIIPAPKGAPEGTQPLAVETADLKTGGQIATQVVNGETVVTNTYSENQTEKVIGENGQEQVYKKADVVDEGSAEAKKPMSIGIKIAIGVGAAAILGVIIYLAVRQKK